MRSKFIFWFLLAIVPWLVISKFTLLIDPPIWPDEAVFYSTSKSILDSGQMATNIYGPAIYGITEYAYWYPPVYFYMLSLWIKIVGSNIEVLRMFSMLMGLVALVVFGLIVKALFKRDFFVFWGVLMLSLERSFMKAAHILRMDIMAFLFMLISLLSFKLIEKKRKYFYMIPGIFAALSGLTHPFGFVILPILILYEIFSQKMIKEKIVNMIFLVIPPIIFTGVWLLSMTQNFDIFVYQFGLQFIRKAHLDNPFVYFFKGDKLWTSFFVFYLIIFVFTIIAYLKQKNAIYLNSLISLFVVTSLIFIGKDLWYLVYLSPFIVLAILSLGQQQKKVFFVSFVSIYFVFQISLLVKENKLGLASDYIKYSQAISANLEPNSAVFLAAIPDPYFYLSKSGSLKLYEFPTEFANEKDYLKLLSEMDYLVINFVPSKLLAIYINQYAISEKIVGDNVYGAKVIKLMSKERRGSL